MGGSVNLKPAAALLRYRLLRAKEFRGRARCLSRGTSVSEGGGCGMREPEAEIRIVVRGRVQRPRGKVSDLAAGGRGQVCFRVILEVW